MKALILAGGLPQIELIKNLNKRGITTILVDGNDKAIARPYADFFYQAAIFDVDVIKGIAVKEKVDFLITVCADQVLLVVAQVSELLGLPCYIDYQTAINVSDKAYMKRIFMDKDIPTSNYVQLYELDIEKTKHLHYPLIVKPVDAYSSKGVRKAKTQEELEEYFIDAHKISRSGEVIIEEFCKGTEISVDAFVENGKAKVLCVTNSEKINDEDRFVIYRGVYHTEISKKILERVSNVVQQIADAFGLVNSPMLVQMITDGDSVSVLEFCARTGGNMKFLMIKHVCGVDVIDAVVDLTLGEKPDVEMQLTEQQYIVNEFIYCYPGEFDHIEGVEELYDAGVITEFCCTRPSGTIITQAHSSSDRIAGFTIEANSKEEFNSKQKRVMDSIKVIDISGKDIMKRDIYSEL